MRYFSNQSTIACRSRCPGWGSRKPGKLSSWVSLCRVQAEASLFISCKTSGQNILMLENKDPDLGKKHGQLSPLSCTAPNLGRHLPQTPTDEDAEYGGEAVCKTKAKLASSRWRQGRGHLRSIYHVPGTVLDSFTSVGESKTRPRNVSMICRLFQTENNQGSKVSGRNVDLPINRLKSCR